MNWIEEEIEDIVKLNEKFSSAFSQIDVEKMDWKPDPQTWSINECLDHIVQSNKKYYDIFDSIESGTYNGGKWVHFPILPRLMGKMVVKAVSPNYKGKSKTFPIFFPLKSSYGKNNTPELLEENKILIEKFKKCKEKFLDKVIVASPVNSFITYSLRDCIKILVEHEKRHYNQAMNLKLKIEQAV
jgi:DinB superfamily